MFVVDYRRTYGCAISVEMAAVSVLYMHASVCVEER